MSLHFLDIAAIAATGIPGPEPSTEVSVTGLILLAAGNSSRLGRPKQLVQYEGKSLLRRAAEAALASQCVPVIVVLGAEESACCEVLKGLAVQIVVNSDWPQGLSTSIRVGIQTLEKSPYKVSAAVFSVCDQPALSREIFDALCDQHRRSGAKIAAAEYAGRLGVPALFAAKYFTRLKSLSGDEGARHLLRENTASIARVPFPGGELDVDTPVDCPPQTQPV